MDTAAVADEESGIRAEIRVGQPGPCPVAEASALGEAVAGSVARSVPVDGAVTEEFTIDAGASVDAPGLAPIYRSETATTFRFVRERAEPCVCEWVERVGAPVADVRARDGALLLTFNVPAVETVKTVVATLRDRYDDVSLVHLSQSGPEGDRDLVVVDRDRLTDRQLEVLETAHRMGYFEYPKGANAIDVADALGIAPSTFSEHLGAAQSKIVDAILHG